MASIYLATDIRNRSKVAIKCLYSYYDDNAIVRARFVDEGRIQMMLQHPNIVRVYELIEAPVLAFVMELIEGGTLEDYLQEQGVLSTQEILEIMVPVMSALGMSHSRGIVHRDLKPSNILLQRAGNSWRPKVMDFGVAKLQREKSLTATGTTVGTLHYMSPEQIVGAKNIDGRADIYSLGITLYKLCTGKVPFNASTEFALMMAQVEARPTPPSELNPQVDPTLEKIILKTLQKKPADRFQTIKELTSALFELKDEHGNETLDTVSVPKFLLDFAMMADVVAVDKTAEIMIRSRELYDAGPTSHQDTSEDLPLNADTKATTVERPQVKGIGRLISPAYDDNAETAEVARHFDNQLGYRPSFGADDDGDPTALTPFSPEELRILQGDDEPTLQSGLEELDGFDDQPTLQGVSDPLDDQPTIEIKNLREAALSGGFAAPVGASSAPMSRGVPVGRGGPLPPRPRVESRPSGVPAARKPWGPQNPPAPARAHHHSSGHGQVPYQRPPAQSPHWGSPQVEQPTPPPPRVVGPQYIDTSEKTLPKVEPSDFAGVFEPLEYQDEPRQVYHVRTPSNVTADMSSHDRSVVAELDAIRDPRKTAFMIFVIVLVVAVALMLLVFLFSLLTG